VVAVPKEKRKYRVTCRLVCHDDDGMTIGNSRVFTDETRAVSKAQAINNCRFRHNISSQYSVRDFGRELWFYEFDVEEVA